MRRNRNQCPSCNAEIGRNYRFCLACGAELEPNLDPDPEPAPAPEPPKKRRKKEKQAPSVPEPVAAVPFGSFDFAAAYEAPAVEPKKRSAGRLRFLLMLTLLVSGAVGGMMYWNEHPSSASNRISWTAITELDFANVWIGRDAASKQDPRTEVPADAVEARAIGVGDDGLVTLRVRGEEVTVQLAGVPENFADQCLGAKGIARLERIVPDDAVAYVLIDGEGRLRGQRSGDTPSVYLWGVNAETGKVRYANEELIAGGEAEFVPVQLDTSDAGTDLERASQRAKDKERGRYADGACS